MVTINNILNKKIIIPITNKEDFYKLTEICGREIVTGNKFYGSHYYCPFEQTYSSSSDAKIKYTGAYKIDFCGEDYIAIELSEIEGFYEDKKFDMKYLISILKKYNIR